MEQGDPIQMETFMTKDEIRKAVNESGALPLDTQQLEAIARFFNEAKRCIICNALSVDLVDNWPNGKICKSCAIK